MVANDNKNYKTIVRYGTWRSCAIASQLTPSYVTTRSSNLLSSSAVHLEVLIPGWAAFFQNSLQHCGLRWPSNCRRKTDCQ